MKIDLEDARVFVRPGATDMRKHINGLAAIAESTMLQSPFTGNLFLFSNRQKTVLKVIYWDKNGFCLWLKRLEKDRFPWPDDEESAREITREEVALLMRGIDFWHEHKELRYGSVL
jgi:transposase